MRLQKLGFFSILLLSLSLTGCGSENLDPIDSGSAVGDNNTGDGTDSGTGGSTDGNGETIYTATVNTQPRVIQRGQTITLNYPLDGTPTSALTYDLVIGGSAVIGESGDYTISSTSAIIFAAGSNIASLTISTIKKDDVYDARSLSLKITAPNGNVATQQFLISGNVYLNDSGMTAYSDTTDFALTSQAGGDFSLQDAAYGLDVIINSGATANNGGDSQDTSSQFYKNSRDVNINDPEYKGKAGFRFVKIADNGMPLPANNSNHSCVKDEVTGLTWQVKSTYNALSNVEPDSSLPAKYEMTDKQRYQASNFSYPWKASALSGVGPGWQNGIDNNGAFISEDNLLANSHCGYNSGFTGRDFELYCSTGSYANETNFLKICGKTNWVVPTVEQLRSIINYQKVVDYSDIGENKHALDSPFFDCSSKDCVIEKNGQDPLYWTSSSVKGAEGLAWCINLQSGHVQTCNKRESHKVLVVSSNVPAEFFNPSSDNSTEASEEE
ncbi:MAG: hypothetical protein ACI86X_000028 [Moritella sp.]|jgi:hypothetical protein